MLDTETERLDAQRKRVTGGILRISSMKLPDMLSDSGTGCSSARECFVGVSFKEEYSSSEESGERQEAR